MTANDFLKKYLEYACYWVPSYGLNNKSTKIRQAQLYSIMCAFGMTNTFKKIDIKANKTDFTLFEEGQFLKGVMVEENQELLNRILKFDDDVAPNLIIPRTEWKKRISLMTIFKELFDFRKKIENLYVPSTIRVEGVGNISGHISQYHKGKILDVIRENLVEIDEILSLIIDPLQRDFSKQYLIDHFNYSNEDLEKIDLDWITKGI